MLCCAHLRRSAVSAAGGVVVFPGQGSALLGPGGMMAEPFTDRRADMPFATILEQFKSLWSENNLSGNVKAIRGHPILSENAPQPIEARIKALIAFAGYRPAEVAADRVDAAHAPPPATLPID